MAYTVREMSEDQIKTAFMRTISKLGTDELSSNKVNDNLGISKLFFKSIPSAQK